jgi:hypothetical protein
MEVSRTQTQTVQATPETKRLESAQIERRRAQVAQEQQPSKVTEPKRQPVVNTQGQTTGRLLNVSA